jgi:ankyrin repeat protein
MERRCPMPQALPANPDLDWLRKAAKKRLVELRLAEPGAKLHQAQLAVARDHGFASWRALKAHLDDIIGVAGERERVFAAARSGDIEAVRHAFASGFDPAMQDRDGRTIYQIAKELRHGAIEILARDIQSGTLYPEAEQDKVQAIATAAQSGDVAALRERLDANPELVDALAGRHLLKATPLHLATIRNRHGAMRLLIERGADLNKRDFPDNAVPMHFAAAHGDLETLRLLVEAGADIEAHGDDHGVGVLGWATCFHQVRHDVAAYLLDHGATLNVWTAIALDRLDELRDMIAQTLPCSPRA